MERFVKSNQYSRRKCRDPSGVPCDEGRSAWAAGGISGSDRDVCQL